MKLTLDKLGLKLGVPFSRILRIFDKNQDGIFHKQGFVDTKKYAALPLTDQITLAMCIVNDSDDSANRCAENFADLTSETLIQVFCTMLGTTDQKLAYRGTCDDDQNYFNSTMMYLLSDAVSTNDDIESLNDLHTVLTIFKTDIKQKVERLKKESK